MHAFDHLPKSTRGLLCRAYMMGHGAFLRSVEDVLVHFAEWGEVPSSIELSLAMTYRMVSKEVVAKLDTHLLLPLRDDPFLRLLVHSLAGYYEMNSATTMENYVLIHGKKKTMKPRDSVCAYMYTTRLTEEQRQFVDMQESKMYAKTVSEVDSEGFHLVIPQEM